MRGTLGWVLLVSVLLAGCSGQVAVQSPPIPTLVPTVDTVGVPAPVVPPTGRVTATQPAVIQGQAAPDRPTPTPWYPIPRYVAPSILPYDPKETIPILPVYACPKQSCQWLGDLPPGLQVSVTSLSDDGLDCFVRGKGVQGWEVEGWVSCSRLAEKPVVTP